MTHDIAQLAAGLTGLQRVELRLIRDDDQGFMARGDQAGLTRIGLAIPPMGQGCYRLTPLGTALRAHLLANQETER